MSTAVRYANLTSCRCILKVQANIYSSGSLTYANFSISIILPMRGPQQTSNNMILWSNFTPFEECFISFTYLYRCLFNTRLRLERLQYSNNSLPSSYLKTLLSFDTLQRIKTNPPTSHASMQILKQWGYQKKLILFFAFNSYLSPYFSWKFNTIVLFKIFH